MGFSGLYFLANTGKPLSELAAVRAVGRDIAHEREYAEGWRLGQIHHGQSFYDPEELAGGLVASTGTPALAMYVSDSEFAMVISDSPQHNRHWFFLNTQAAMSIYEPWEERPEPASDEETIAQLLIWAAEADLPASAKALALALPHSPGPFGEGVRNLVLALGVQE
jgi:hypothetical protein